MTTLQRNCIYDFFCKRCLVTEALKAKAQESDSVGSSDIQGQDLWSTGSVGIRVVVSGKFCCFQSLHFSCGGNFKQPQAP